MDALPPPAWRMIRAALAALAVAAAACAADAQPAADGVTCPNGASVDVEARCAAFATFANDDSPPDERVARNLHLAAGEFARSIAVVVGVSLYQNPRFDLPAARVDVDRLRQFLVGDQRFDEVIILENDHATIDNIRYFLRTYAMRRAAYYGGKVRFLFAFSGHGVPMAMAGQALPQSDYRPSVGLALWNAADDRDLQNIYGLNELRPLFTDLAKNTFHFLALINACWGGDVFGLAMSGGDVNDTSSRSSFGITAGPADGNVISVGKGHGSLFFDTVIDGVETGEADPDARKVTLGVSSRPRSLDGIVRLGPLDSYISEQVLNTLEAGGASPDELRGNLHHWSGAISPDGVVSLGGFFFFQHRPPPVHVASLPAPGQVSAFVSSLHVGEAFAPSLNQILSTSGDADVLGRLRSGAGVIRGIDVSHYSKVVDWGRVAKAGIRFAYLKATQGGDLVDTSFATNWKDSKEAGLARGAYHAFSFCASPEQQMSSIRRVVPQDAGSLPIAVDVELYEGQEESNFGPLLKEGACAARLGKDQARRNLDQLLGEIQRAYGVAPIVYGNDFALDSLLGAAFTSRFRLWRADYGVRRTPRQPWSIWQYTENERVDGIAGPVDMNVLSKDSDHEATPAR